jgi:sucrose phosphorylase
MAKNLDWTPIQRLLEDLYGQEGADRALSNLAGLFNKYVDRRRGGGDQPLTEKDAILITYGDQVQNVGQSPLEVLDSFFNRWLRGKVSGIHLLPFFPYSSDDGFSVIDYREVDPVLGSWDDIERLGEHFKLMFDLVLNHVSAESAWFRGYLQGEPRYQDYFIEIHGHPDLSAVVRPRTLPLLTEFTTASGVKQLWTTFSSDQVDLNYQDPAVLVEMVDILLDYLAHGAGFIRLDAIAYLWKQPGTSCIHLPQTHAVVQLLRAILEAAAPHVKLITETNVPHAENIAYFGNGQNEAHLVYNFALPPLVLHTFLTGSSRALSRWASDLELPSKQISFFNFLASHDGIGVTPARGLISTAEIENLVDKAIAHGGLVSYRDNPDGSQSPYELNINYFDALSDPRAPELAQTQIDRFIAAHAIMTALVGLPGIYFHSLFGSRNWIEGARKSGANRAINRQKLELAELDRELNNQYSLRARVFSGLIDLIQKRSSQPAFDPYGSQQVLQCSEEVFGLLRADRGEKRFIVCLHSVVAEPVQTTIDPMRISPFRRSEWIDLFDRSFKRDLSQPVYFAPYQVRWLTPGVK